jgi:hypothetical protein
VVIEVFFKDGGPQKEIDHSETVAELREKVDDLSKKLRSRDGLSEIIRKWDSPLETGSEHETQKFEEYINRIVDKTVEIEWSFVLGYEQQPSFYLPVQ